MSESRAFFGEISRYRGGLVATVVAASWVAAHSSRATLLLGVGRVYSFDGTGIDLGIGGMFRMDDGEIFGELRAQRFLFPSSASAEERGIVGEE